MNKILITGAAGFIGVKLARELINKKNKIYLLDNLSRGKSDIFFKEILKNKDVHFFKKDLNKKLAFKENFDYCADSTGYWRFEPLDDVLKNHEIKNLQVLTHDSMWSNDVLPPRRRVYEAIDVNAKRQKEWYDKTLFNFGAKNVDWKEEING